MARRITIENRIDAAIECSELNNLLWAKRVIRGDHRLKQPVRLPDIAAALAVVMAEAPRLTGHSRASLFRHVGLIEAALGLPASELPAAAVAAWDAHGAAWDNFCGGLVPAKSENDAGTEPGARAERVA